MTTTEVKLEQSLNASYPMYVTLEGIVIEVRPEQPKNAKSPILVTLEGMIVFLQPAISVLDLVSIIALQLSRESYLGFLSSTIILVRLRQPCNPSSMLVTLEGMVIEVRPEQL